MSNAGWTKLDNDLFDMMPLLSHTEWAVLCVLIRQTSGYQRKAARVAVSFFADATGANYATARKALQSLVEYGVVCVLDEGAANFGRAPEYAIGEIPNIAGLEERASENKRTARKRFEKKVPALYAVEGLESSTALYAITPDPLYAIEGDPLYVIEDIKESKEIKKDPQTASAVCSAPENLQSAQGAQGAQENSTQSENCDHKQTHSLIGNETANLEPQSKNYNPDLDCQIRAPAVPPLPEAKPTKKPRKPRELSDKERAIVRLNAAFADARGVQPPSFSSPKAAKSAQVNWNAAHSELLANAGGDVDFAERVIRRVVGEYTASADSLNNRYPMIEPRSFRARYIQEAAAEKQRARAAMKAQQQQQPTAQQEDERIPVTRLAIPAFALK